MAFVPEDGTGLSTANSYITLAYAETYHDDRGNTSWASATSSTQQAACIKATDYIQSNFIFTGGVVASATQALQWPRYSAIDRNGNLIDSDSVPDVVKQATAILALEVVGGTDINAKIDRKTKREKAGPVEVEYMDGSAARVIYRQIEGLFVGLIAARGQGTLARS